MQNTQILKLTLKLSLDIYSKILGANFFVSLIILKLSYFITNFGFLITFAIFFFKINALSKFKKIIT